MPARLEMGLLPVWDARMVEDEQGIRSVWPQLDTDNGIDAVCPAVHTPGLHDPAVFDELNDPAADNAAVTGEGAADIATDHRRPVGGEGLVLGGVHQSVIDALRPARELDLLVDAHRPSCHGVRQ